MNSTNKPLLFTTVAAALEHHIFLVRELTSKLGGLYITNDRVVPAYSWVLNVTKGENL